MNRTIVVLAVLVVVIGAATTPGLAAQEESSPDPDEVDIVSIDGEDADRVNEIAIDVSADIQIELDGVDVSDRYLLVEIGGNVVSHLEEAEESIRPRSDADISTGEQTLRIIWEERGKRTVLAETEVRVTSVDLEREDRDDDRLDLDRDDSTDLDVDPASVTLVAVNGEEPNDLELALRYDEEISVDVDGPDVADHTFQVALDRIPIGSVGSGESVFRPRTDVEVSTGEQTLQILTRGGNGESTVVAEAPITITEVTLDRDADRAEIDPANVSIATVNGEPADQRNEIRLTRGSPLSLDIDGVAIPEHGFYVEIGGAFVGVIEEAEGDVRIRRGSEVTTGDQTLTVVWESRGNRTVLAETPVTVTEIDVDSRQFEDSPEDVDLEIVSVNGEPADGIVVTEHDLRGETPIEMEVEGLAETDLEPTIRYKSEALSPRIDGFEISGDRLSLVHLPRIEDGEVEELELVTQTGREDFYVYDSVRIEYRHVDGADLSSATDGDESSAAADEADDGGILSGFFDMFGGGEDTTEDDESIDADGTDEQEEDVTDEDGSEDGGGLISTIRRLFGL